MNFSPTHLTSVETDKGKINVSAKKVGEDQFYLEFGYPLTRGAAYFQLPNDSGLDMQLFTVSKEEMDKVLKPIL